MKISKIASIVAAAAMAVSVAAVSASATNWANTSYADNNPDTVQILSTDENSMSFTATEAGMAAGTGAKARITAGELLDDPTQVKSATWTITYTVPSDADVPATGFGGGCYFGCKNSTTYWVNPDYDDDGNASWSTGTYTVQDDAKFLLPTEGLTADSELVFMDWSQNAGLPAVTITITDLKFFDADGNEIAQKAYAGAAAATEEAAPAAEETTEAAPAADATTTAASTGNTAVASIAAVMAAAGVAAIATKKRK